MHSHSDTATDEASRPPSGGRAAARPPSPEDRPPVGEPLVTSRRARRGRPHGEAEATGPAPVEVPPAPPPPPFAGRSVLVTGATSELGAAFAAAFADLGAELHLLDAELGALRELAAALPTGTRSLVLCCDLGSVAEIRSVGEFLDRSEAVPDVVVHAARVSEAGSALGSPIEDLDEHYLIGVRGPTVLLQSIAPRLEPGSTVVFADRDDAPAPGDAHRSVADGARRRLVDALRDELVALGVTVMAARCTEDTPVDDVVAGVVEAVATERRTDVVDVTLRPRVEVPEG